MKKLLTSIVIIASLFSGLVVAGEYAVIANKKIHALSSGEIKAVFLKKLVIVGDMDVVPVNLSVRDELRKKFEKHILHMNFRRLKSYWSKQHYLGRRPPLNMKSQQSVIAFVKKVESALAYVDLNNIDSSNPDIHVIYSWSD